jgi:hypothetical protein
VKAPTQNLPAVDHIDNARTPSSEDVDVNGLCDYDWK